jgi:hypothetical protein
MINLLSHARSYPKWAEEGNLNMPLYSRNQRIDSATGITGETYRSTVG